MKCPKCKKKALRNRTTIVRGRVVCQVVCSHCGVLKEKI